jgi:hypothetical protein
MTDKAIDFGIARRRAAPRSGAVLGPLLGAAVRALTQIFAMPSSQPSDRAAREAGAVRMLAHRYRDTDRGFAADLYAAADRHEEAARAARPGSAADRR